MQALNTARINNKPHQHALPRADEETTTEKKKSIDEAASIVTATTPTPSSCGCHNVLLSSPRHTANNDIGGADNAAASAAHNNECRYKSSAEILSPVNYSMSKIEFSWEESYYLSESFRSGAGVMTPLAAAAAHKDGDSLILQPLVASPDVSMLRSQDFMTDFEDYYGSRKRRAAADSDHRQQQRTDDSGFPTTPLRHEPLPPISDGGGGGGCGVAYNDYESLFATPLVFDSAEGGDAIALTPAEECGGTNVKKRHARMISNESTTTTSTRYSQGERGKVFDAKAFSFARNDVSSSYEEKDVGGESGGASFSANKKRRSKKAKKSSSKNNSRNQSTSHPNNSIKSKTTSSSSSSKANKKLILNDACRNEQIAEKTDKNAAATTTNDPPLSFRAPHTKTQLSDAGATNTTNSAAVGCRCSKSRCLKLYCDCFQKQLFCSADRCSCVDCLNTRESSKMREDAIAAILLRRPDAFDKKIKKTGEGCSCKKNRCLKKYCDCFSNGLKCKEGQCRCNNCQNMNDENNNENEENSSSDAGYVSQDGSSMSVCAGTHDDTIATKDSFLASIGNDVQGLYCSSPIGDSYDIDHRDESSMGEDNDDVVEGSVGDDDDTVMTLPRIAEV